MPRLTGLAPNPTDDEHPPMIICAGERKYHA